MRRWKKKKKKRNLFIKNKVRNGGEKRALRDGKITEGVSPLVEKYWFQRYDLFRRYDDGILLDEEGWFSVTPEEIAVRHALHCCGLAGVVIDCFAGVGGNAIQFARVCDHVVAIDIDPKKIALARNNAKIYGVEDNIDFIVGDFFQIAPSLKGDVVFLSPPWGGPSYKTIEKFTLDLLKPRDGNVDLLEVEQLSWLSSPPLDIEIEGNIVRGNLKGITIYFGNAAIAQLCLPQTLSS